jgi:hypothetical protein
MLRALSGQLTVDNRKAVAPEDSRQAGEVAPLGESLRDHRAGEHCEDRPGGERLDQRDGARSYPAQQPVAQRRGESGDRSNASPPADDPRRPMPLL